MSNRKGFILKEYLLSLIIIMIFFPLIISAARLISDVEYFDHELQNELSILKLRDKLITANIKSIDNFNVIYEQDNVEWLLKYDGSRLYLSPGYQLFLDNVDDLNFMIKDDLLYVNYYIDNKNYERYLKII